MEDVSYLALQIIEVVILTHAILRTHKAKITSVQTELS